MRAAIQATRIADQTCPSCGARLVSLAQTRKHSNGQWFEEAKYECGYHVEWQPNMGQLEIMGACLKCDGHKLAHEHAQMRSYEARSTLDTLSLGGGFVDYTIYRFLMDKVVATPVDYWTAKLRKFKQHSDAWTVKDSPDVEEGDYIVAADGRLWMVESLSDRQPQVVPITKPNKHPVPLEQAWRMLSDISDFQ